MKKADKSNAKLAFIIGDNEIEKKSITIKLLREDGSQDDILESNILSYLNEIKIG
jgi:histidyl-tRNA synthetase